MKTGLGRHKTPIVVLILTLSLGSSLGAYEVWRSSTESQIVARIDFLNRNDGSCSYIVSNVEVMPFFDGATHFTDPGIINKTEVSDWGSVVAASATVKSNLGASSLTCKIFFGLTRTTFVLLGPQGETGSGIYVVNLVFTRYAPF